MAYSDDIVETLAFSIKNYFPELANEIKQFNQNIEIANIYQALELDKQYHFLESDTKTKMIDMIKQYSNHISEPDTFSKLKKP